MHDQRHKLTWQSSTLVLTTPCMYCLSKVGVIPKLFPIKRFSTFPSEWLISTVPFKITYHESSYREKKTGFKNSFFFFNKKDNYMLTWKNNQ